MKQYKMSDMDDSIKIFKRLDKEINSSNFCGYNKLVKLGMMSFAMEQILNGNGAPTNKNIYNWYKKYNNCVRLLPFWK